MTLNNYLTAMSLTTALCWGIFLFVVNIINPEETNYIGFSLFYLSLLLSLIGTIAILGFFVRFIVLRKSLAVYAVKNAFRQAFLISFFLICLLFLFSLNLITYLNLALLIIIFLILEIIFSSFKKYKKNKI